MANARDLDAQDISFEGAGDAEAVVFPEIGVTLVGGEAATARGMRAEASIAADSPVESIDPEYFMFATELNVNDYLRGAIRALQNCG